MEATGFSIHHFLLVILASRVGHAQLVANATSPAVTSAQNTTRSESAHTSPESVPPDANATGPGCLIDPQLGLVAAASAGGLVVCLLVSTVVLACQVWRLKRRARAPRPSRSNADLVSGTGYWGTDARAEGIEGPCDSAVMLEEVRADGRAEDWEEEEEERDREEEEEEEGGGGAGTNDVDLGGGGVALQSSNSRDSCQEDMPLDLENMPLVV